MHSTVTEKVPGGKLVRIKIDFDKTINSCQITGDFFCYPEDMIEEVEKSILGAPAASDILFLKNRIEKKIRENKTELVGVTSDDIARLITKALEQKPEGNQQVSSS